MRAKDMKRVLVGCEYSGTVRDTFSLKGWDAWSCDLLPTESELTKQEGKHYQCDIFDVLYQDWDLLIAHPPCTYLSYSGNAFWDNPGRISKRLEALDFFRMLWEADIPHICLENPKSCASPVIAKYTQSIQPYYFGDASIKTTWLWLKNLPKLEYSEETNLFKERTSVMPQKYFCNSGKTKDILKRFGTTEGKRGLCGSHNRSKFHKGITNAMAEQWTEYFDNKLKLQ